MEFVHFCLLILPFIEANFIWIHFFRSKCFRLSVVNQNKWRAHNNKCCSIFHTFFVIFSIWLVHTLIAIHSRLKPNYCFSFIIFLMHTSTYMAACAEATKRIYVYKNNSHSLTESPCVPLCIDIISHTECWHNFSIRVTA